LKKITLKTVQMNIRGREAIVQEIVCPACGQTVEAEISPKGDPIPLDYAETLLIVLDSPPREGFSVAEMRKRLLISDKLEGAQMAEADHVLLEDAEHKTLAALVREHRFRLSHYAILEFIDAIEGAPGVEVEVKEELQTD
jgi:hypothetical protein